MTDHPDDARRETRTAERLGRSYSVPELVVKLLRDIGDLLQKESDLIRSELSDKIAQLRVGVGKIAAGAIVLLVALITLSQALVVALAKIIGEMSAESESTGWASLIVGGVFAAVGAFLVRSGASDLTPENLTPDRTTLQMRRDSELAREQMR